jgi:two-component system, cell cycle sensor histidine kinase and response regulator CckA
MGVIKDTENNFLLGNKSFSLSLNLIPGDLKGKSAFQLFSKELANKYWQDDLDVIASGKTKTDIIEKGLRVGQEGIFSTSKVPLFNGNGAIIGVIGISTDITILKKMEKELLNVKKFEAATVFAGGICHDFNNLLAIIVGYADLALHKLDKASPVYSMVQAIAQSSLKTKSLTSRFLDISSTGVPVKGLFSLEKIVENAISVGVDESEINCEYIFSENIWRVAMDPSQVGQVICNVVNNAKEAMPDGGHISISIDNIDGRTAAKETHVSMEKEKYVRVIVEDSGSGISEKNMSTIFDPYFSTKKRGNEKGMGLGLTICYSIIRKHDGYIQVESKHGSGTSVIIYLPAE